MYNYEIYQDNAGNYHFAAVKEGICIYYFHDNTDSQIKDLIAAAKSGEAPEDWEGGEKNPEECYREIIKIVEDHNGGALDVTEEYREGRG